MAFNTSRKHKRKVGNKVLAYGKKVIIKEVLWSRNGTPVYVVTAIPWVLHERDLKDISQKQVGKIGL